MGGLGLSRDDLEEGSELVVVNAPGDMQQFSCFNAFMGGGSLSYY
jgi:hypothetical protein